MAEMKPLSTCRTRLCPYLTRLYLIYNFLSLQQQQQQKTLNGTANGQKSTNVLAIQQQQGCVCIPLSWVRIHIKFRDNVEFLNQIVQHFPPVVMKGVRWESRLRSRPRRKRLQRNRLSWHPLPEWLGWTPDTSMHSTRLALRWRRRLWRQFR